MSDEKNNNNIQPHGVEQQIKMNLVKMIHSGENPFDIIYYIAKELEKVSDEPGYAKYVEDQLRTVYGFALKHVKPMQDELAEVEARLKRIENHTKILNLPKKNILASALLSIDIKKISTG